MAEQGENIVYAFAAIALALIVFLLMRRNDPRVATLKSLPKYGSPEAATLHQAVAAHGPARLLLQTDGTFNLLDLEPPRTADDFREQIAPEGRSLTSPAARWRRARVKPVRPKPTSAPRARPGFAPPQMLLVPAVRCRICNRPLTNAESRRRGVGPDCYRTYGARVVHAPNPAFADWSNRKALLEAQQAAWQALLDEIFRQLMQRFEEEMKNWSETSPVAA